MCRNVNALEQVKHCNSSFKQKCQVSSRNRQKYNQRNKIHTECQMFKSTKNRILFVIWQCSTYQKNHPLFCRTHKMLSSPSKPTYNRTGFLSFCKDSFPILLCTLAEHLVGEVAHPPDSHLSDSLQIC